LASFGVSMLIAGWRRMSVFVRDDTVSTGRRMMRSGLRDGARPGSLQQECPGAPQK
jgi:hypothetical protein